jgi:hypothetical protein
VIWVSVKKTVTRPKLIIMCPVRFVPRTFPDNSSKSSVKRSRSEGVASEEWLARCEQHWLEHSVREEGRVEPGARGRARASAQLSEA